MEPRVKHDELTRFFYAAHKLARMIPNDCLKKQLIFFMPIMVLHFIFIRFLLLYFCMLMLYFFHIWSSKTKRCKCNVSTCNHVKHIDLPCVWNVLSNWSCLSDLRVSTCFWSGATRLPSEFTPRLRLTAHHRPPAAAEIRSRTRSSRQRQRRNRSTVLPQQVTAQAGCIFVLIWPTSPRMQV